MHTLQAVGEALAAESKKLEAAHAAGISATPETLNWQAIICFAIPAYNALGPWIGMLFGITLPVLPIPSFCTTR